MSSIDHLKSSRSKWRKTTIGGIARNNGLIIDGDWVETKDQDPNGEVRLIQLADIGDGKYLNKSARFLTMVKAKELKCTFLKEGDILIARMPEPLGRACIFPGEDRPCVTVVDVCILRPDSTLVDTRWLLWAINSPAFRFRLDRFISGTTRPRISRKNLEKIELEFPPLLEQRRIAAILDKADTLREKRRQAIAKLDTLLQSVFLEMFGDPVTNPKKWETAHLGEVAEIASGAMKGRKFNGHATVLMPYLRVANVQDGFIDLREIKEIEVLAADVERYCLQYGDVLMTEGGDPDKLGRGAIWRGEIKNCIHQNHIFRVRVNHQYLFPEFLSGLIRSERGKRYFLQAAKQTTGIATINMTELRGFPVLLPPIDLQKQYLKFLEMLQSLATKVNRSSEKFEGLFQSLQQGAFTGKLFTFTDKLFTEETGTISQQKLFPGLTEIENG